MKANIEYETSFCKGCCFLHKECAMSVLNDDVDFDYSLIDLFPTDPFPALDLYHLSEPELKALPVKGLEEKFIPMVTGTYSHKESTITVPVKGLKLNAKYNKDAHTSFPNVDNVGLVISAKDVFLHKFIQSDNINGGDWAERLAPRKFDFVLSPQISFYYNQPSCATVYNRFLTYKSIKELIDASLPVVPQLSYLWESDAIRYVKWIKKSKFKYVYINLQQVKYDSAFVKVLELVKNTSVLVGKDIEIVILGVFNIDRIKALEKIRSFRYITTALHILATMGVEWKNGKERKLGQFEEMYYEDIMQSNLLNYRKALKKAGVI